MKNEVFNEIKDLEFECPECEYNWNDDVVCPICQQEGRNRISVLDFIESLYYDESLIEDLTIECPDCINVEDDQYCCTTCWQEGGNGKINVLSYLKEYHPEVF